MRQAAIFVRVSTVDKQNYDRQIDDLRDYCEKNELQVSCVIGEKVSGAKVNEERQGIQELLSKARDAQFSVIVVAEISRLGRSPLEVHKIIEEMNGLGISIHIQTMNLQTIDNNGNRSPVVSVLVSILAEFARLERETLITRIKSGLEKAKKNGVTLGRKKGSVISSDMLLKKYRGVVKDLEQSLSMRKIARIHSVSLCTILKVKKAMGV